MTRAIAWFFCVLVLIGGVCGDVAAQATATEDKVAEAVKKLKKGMKEEEVLKIMKPVSVEQGTTYWGGTGARSHYFALPGKKQIEVSIGAGDNGLLVVKEIGPVEPKCAWTRHRDGTVSVADRPEAGK